MPELKFRAFGCTIMNETRWGIEADDGYGIWVIVRPRYTTKGDAENYIRELIIRGPTEYGEWHGLERD